MSIITYCATIATFALASLIEGTASAEVVYGELGERDELHTSGQFIDWIEVEMSAGQVLEVRGSSDTLDIVVYVETSTGQYFSDDDSGSGTNSLIKVPALVDGVFSVGITSVDQKPTQGAYRILTQVLNETLTFKEIPLIENEEEITHQLSVANEMSANTYYTFTAEQGSTVVFELEEDTFGTFAIYGPNGFFGSPGIGYHTGTRMAFHAPDGGHYYVLLQDIEVGEKVRINTKADPSELGDWAISENGKVRGVFIGISKYADENYNLPYCNQDAIGVAAAFKSRYDMADEDVLILTNEEATVEGILGAIQQMSEKCNPEDLLVVFYSGHGNQAEGEITIADPDGKDETLVAHDLQEIIDHEFTAALNSSKANHVMLMMDCCFSGGFDKDFVVVPGRVGIFSSEGDCLSLVASKFSSGGYLSHFIRQGINTYSMEVDANSDRLVTIHEFTHFMQQRFEVAMRDDAELLQAGSVGDFITPDNPAFQRPILDRDAVAPSLILYSY